MNLRHSGLCLVPVVCYVGLLYKIGEDIVCDNWLHMGMEAYGWYTYEILVFRGSDVRDFLFHT